MFFLTAIELAFLCFTYALLAAMALFEVKSLVAKYLGYLKAESLANAYTFLT